MAREFECVSCNFISLSGRRGAPGGRGLLCIAQPAQPIATPLGDGPIEKPTPKNIINPTQEDIFVSYIMHPPNTVNSARFGTIRLLHRLYPIRRL